MRNASAKDSSAGGRGKNNRSATKHNKPAEPAINENKAPKPAPVQPPKPVKKQYNPSRKKQRNKHRMQKRNNDGK